MRIAALLLLAAAAPAEACMGHISPGEQMLMMASGLFGITMMVSWGLGLLAYGFSLGERGHASMALATLSVGFVEAGMAAAFPLAYAQKRIGERGESIMLATVLVMLCVAPILAWRSLRSSEARGGRLLGRAGSPLFPLAMLASVPLAMASEVAGAAVLFAPLLALIAVAADHLPAPRPAPSLSPLAVAAGHCPVCREVVRDRLQECARCHTPHHKECLAFNGRCGIFACEPGAPDPTAKKKAS